MSDQTFTGERLHEGETLFRIDVERHRAPYRFVLEQIERGRILDLGSGSGYGVAELAGPGRWILGVDRVPPDPAQRCEGTAFVRGDLEALPLAAGSFDAVVSFQVIEHLVDPGPYLRTIVALLRRDGVALLTTPNRLTSDGANPFHVHEYTADELAGRLRAHFESVEMLGVGAIEAVARYYDARLRRVRRLARLDPLGLRYRLPRPLIEWVLPRAARLVRSSIRRSGEFPAATWRDFPIGPARDDCLDLLVICRRPRG